jgi:hypothetical protein
MAGPFQGSDLNPALNTSGQTGATPREYNAHQRYSNLTKRRHDNQLAAYLAAEATKLSLTSAQVFAKLTTNPAARITAATTSGGLA